VLAEVSKVVAFLGFYPFTPVYDLLDQVKSQSKPVMMIGLIFNMINVLFIGISSILIYSLLNITAS